MENEGGRKRVREVEGEEEERQGTREIEGGGMRGRNSV